MTGPSTQAHLFSTSQPEGEPVKGKPGPFTLWARGYQDRDFSPLPILAGTKKPGANGHLLASWTRFCVEPVSRAQLDAWLRDTTAGLGICCGYRGLVALDVDHRDAYEAVREVFGTSGAPGKIGQRGATYFFRDPTGAITSRDLRGVPLIGEDGRKRQTMLVQILAAGRQTIAPPSVHPQTGKPYRWHGGDLETCRPEDLPVITAEHIAALADLLAPLMAEPVTPPARPHAVTPAHLSERQRRRYAAWATAALDRAATNLADRQKPGRSNCLYGVARALAPYIADFLTEKQVREALLTACKHNRLIADNGRPDVLRSIQRGLEHGRSEGLPTLPDETTKG